MPRTHYREDDMDETARLILMTAAESTGKINLSVFAEEFRKPHPDSDTTTVARFWAKYCGTDYFKPTHDFWTGHSINPYTGSKR